MSGLSKILYYCVYSVISSIISPVYWIVLLIIFFQYNRMGKMERQILGGTKEPLYKKIITSSIVGLLGGIIGSIIFMCLGTTVQSKDFYFILPIALILSLIHPRFICFSYAGGIISISNLLFKYPKINISSIMTIIAVLHLIESFLIIINGHSGKIPIFMEKENKVVGGFNMNRFWPVPFTLFFNNGYGVFPITIIAVLGYGDFVLTKYPKQKCKETAKNLLLFSVILLILSQLSIHYKIFQYIAALFSPIFHEFIIQYGRKKEEKGNPIFLPSLSGLKILDTLSKGVGEKIGLRTGDVIYSINGSRIYSIEDVKEVFRYKPSHVLINLYDKNKNLITKEYKDYKNGIKSLDILIIPRNPNYLLVVEEARSPINIFIDKIKKKIN